MATRRKTTKLRKGDIIDVVEYPDGNYGAPGMSRQKKKKPTKEQMIQINLLNKARRCRLRMLEYITPGDLFVTWTYRLEERPPDMKTALKQFQAIMKKVRKHYKKQGCECFWFRNIERGTRGAWHIHLVINNVPGAKDLLEDVWEYGEPHIVSIRKSKFYSEDFTELANYITKDQNSIEYKKDGTIAKSKIKEASYWTSKNMPLPEPKVDKLVRWKKEAKPKKGYYIVKDSFYEGVHKATGYMYRRYTMIRLNRRI